MDCRFPPIPSCFFSKEKTANNSSIIIICLGDIVIILGIAENSPQQEGPIWPVGVAHPNIRARIYIECRRSFYIDIYYMSQTRPVYVYLCHRETRRDEWSTIEVTSIRSSGVQEASNCGMRWGFVIYVDNNRDKGPGTPPAGSDIVNGIYHTVRGSLYHHPRLHLKTTCRLALSCLFLLLQFFSLFFLLDLSFFNCCSLVLWRAPRTVS